MRVKERKSKAGVSSNTFNIPNKTVHLEKLGKMFGGMVIRDCFMTKDKFGQIKGGNLKTILKPNVFVDQHVYLQDMKTVTAAPSKPSTPKNQTAEQKKKAKALKARKLKWPDVKKFKQLKGMQYRVKFEEMMGKGRPRAIFMSQRQDCENLKNHVVMKKLQIKEPQLLQKVQSMATIFKVKQAEYFYEQELKPFVKSTYSISHLQTFNNELTSVMEECGVKTKEKPKNLGGDKSEFRLGVHKGMAKLSENMIIDDKKKLFATRIDMHLDILDNLGDIDPLALGRSPFQEIYKGISPNARTDALELIKNAKNILRIEGLLADNESFEYLRLILANSVVVTKVEKMVIENNPDSELPNSMFQVEIKNLASKEKETDSCNSYKSNENKLYNTFELDTSILCPGESISKLNVSVKDIFTGAVVYNEEINLIEKLERVHLENTVYQSFEINVKGATAEDEDYVLSGVLQFNIVLFPTNLETAHLLCPEEILEKQFDHFEKTTLNIRDFDSYRKNFFQETLQKIKQDGHSGRDLFYYRNKFVDKEHHNVQFQDNSLAQCRRFQNIEWFQSKLGGIFSSNSISFDVLVTDNINRMHEDFRYGEDFIYDLYIRVSYLLSPTERVLLNRAVFKTSNEQYFGNPDFKISEDMEVSRAHLRIINSDLDTYFHKIDYMTLTQREVIKNITHRVFFFLSNNKIAGKKYSFHYSSNYIPLIANLVLVNEKDIGDKDLVMICVNAILSTTLVCNYTYTNHINYLSNAVAFFKFLFKRLYPDHYIEITKLLVEFDMILAGFLVNSFADIFDRVNTNIYMDMKLLLDMLFSVNNDSIGFISSLKDFGLNMPTFIDIMFLLQSFTGMFHKFKYATEPHQIRLTMEAILIKNIQSAELSFKQILQLIDYVKLSQFFDDEFSTYREGLTETHLKTATDFMQLKTALRKANLKEDVLTKIINEKLVKNNLFCFQLQSMYKSSGEDDDEEEKKKPLTPRDVGESGYDNFDTVDEDIFFEVAEEGQPFYDDLPGKGTDPIAMRYLSCLVHLNNMDMALMESMSNQHKLKANLNNIYELNEAEFEEMVLSYVNVPKVVIPKLFESLTQLAQSSRVPVLKFIVLLILSVTEDFEKTAEQLSYLIHTLSSIIFREVATLDIEKNEAPFTINAIIRELNKEKPDLEKESKIHFSEIVKYVVTEVASMTPFNNFNFFLERMVDVQHPNVSIDIKHAKLHLGFQVIDITELCIRHHVTSTYIEGRPCLLFNDIFNDWMTDIFSTLLKEEEIDDNCSKFDIFLEVYIGEKIRHYRIPFRIVHIPEIQVFCKQNQRIYFDKDFGEECLFPKSTFVKLFKQMPYNFLDSTQASTIPTTLFGSSKKLVVTFKLGNDVITTVSCNFRDVDLENPHDIQPWAFKNKNAAMLVKMSTNNIAINLPFSVFFFEIKDLIYHVVQLILPKVKEVDFFLMIKLNFKFYELTTVTGKKVDTKLMLSELSDYHKNMKNNTDVNLIVSLKKENMK